MVKTSVRPELIEWAVDRSMVPRQDLRAKLPKLSKWLDGSASPSLAELQRLSKATHTPLGYFFFSRPPKLGLPIPDFRTIGNEVPPESPGLRDTILTIQYRQAAIKQLLIAADVEPLPIPSNTKGSIRLRPTELAKSIRDRLDLPSNWITKQKSKQNAFAFLRKACEQFGIFIFTNSNVDTNTHRPLDPNDFRGFALTDSHAPTIFINDADAVAARIFTLAHEIAHIWVGQPGVSNQTAIADNSNKIEWYCNKVAAEILIPRREFQELWESTPELPDKLASLSRQFHVSRLVVARRASDIGYISATAYKDILEHERDIWENIRNQRRKTKSKGDFFNTQGYRLGKRFSEAIAFAAEAGTITYREAYRLTGMRGATYTKYMSRFLRRRHDN